MKLRLPVIIVCAVSALVKSAADAPDLDNSSYAWRLSEPLGSEVRVDMDSLLFNYGQRSVPAMQTDAYASTGNLGAEGVSLVYFDRAPASDFFFRDALAQWLPQRDNMLFYNTRIPLTILSYNFGGSKTTGQDRLKADFSGNINPRAQVGAMVDYLHSKGSYANQAAKHLSWGVSGSYLGERYQFQGYYYHYNSLNNENGGITDDRYITDPAAVQGGLTSVDTKNIPTRLSQASSRLVGGQLLLCNKYNLGFHRDVEMADTVVSEFVPVTSILWDFNFTQARHGFNNLNASQGNEFWADRYLSPDVTYDRSSYYSVKNTFGLSLLEGFNRWAKAGLSAFVVHEYTHFKQDPYSVLDDSADATSLTPLPAGTYPPAKGLNMAWVGAQLARRSGRILNYEATGQIGFLGEAAGEVRVDGHVDTRFSLLSDTVSLKAYGHFSNLTVPYLLRHYISNHFAWDNDFGMTRRLRFGGELALDRVGTHLNIGVENVQNLVYFNADCLPSQHSGSVQVFSASLRQRLHFKALHFDNSITYQKSADNVVIPIPQLVVYSNLYLYFRLAKVMQVQFGIDCSYYTKYKAPGYQPATMAFYNQQSVECGNFPYMNFYVNMKLKRARFYLMMSHVNQGMFGDNYFSIPGYPLNPRKFQLGISVDFMN